MLCPGVSGADSNGVKGDKGNLGPIGLTGEISPQKKISAVCYGALIMYSLHPKVSRVVRVIGDFPATMFQDSR